MGHTEVVPEPVGSSQRSYNAIYEQKITKCIQYIKLLSGTVTIIAAICLALIGVLSWHIVTSGIHQDQVLTQNVGRFHSVCRSKDLSQIPQDCREILARNQSAESGVYQIHPTTPTCALNVYCDMTTRDGGWIVFQRRKDGSEDFYRDWVDYKNGFGNLAGEIWLGLETIHNFVSEGKWEMLVNMKDNSTGTKYALYKKFEIGSESSGYMVTIGNYTGDATDSMKYHNGMKFTTKDRDNDLHEENCAELNSGAWWYNKCRYCELNKPYGQVKWNGVSNSIEFVEMKMRTIV